MKEGYINVGAEMQKDLERKARILSARMGLSRSEFFRQALEHFILVKEKELEQSESQGKVKTT
jgi:metal-responsive CopG/Arc/MetJ family transcriptional regulator